MHLIRRIVLYLKQVPWVLFWIAKQTLISSLSLSLCNYVMIIQKYEASLPCHPSFSDRLGLNTKNCRYKIIIINQLQLWTQKIIGIVINMWSERYENTSRFHIINVIIFQLTDFTSFLHCKIDEARDKMKDSRAKPKQACSLFYFN